ncbi:hypothetical protein Q5705_02000 [Kosakonia sp. H02]|nr:hypothetical protein Q5705_02000 [Kosakonia sp. H02]
MLLYIKRSYILSAVISRKIKTNDLEKLEFLKDRLKDRLGAPVGWHMVGISFVTSMVLNALSFTMPQSFAWLALFRWAELPEYAVTAAILPFMFTYCVILVSSLFFTARGFLWAFKLYLLITLLTAVLALSFFVFAVISLVSSAGNISTLMICSVLGLVFIASSIKCLNSSLFFRSNALYLHNRVWRKQSKIQQQLIQTMKRK